MSILQDFYTVNSHKSADSTDSIFDITIQKAHPIFAGHFPNNPVTPGVCMLQIIKELSEKQTDRNLLLSKARNIKFMAIINPEIQPKIQVALQIEPDTSSADGTNGNLIVKSIFSYQDPQSGNEIIALKFSGTFVEETLSH